MTAARVLRFKRGRIAAKHAIKLPGMKAVPSKRTPITRRAGRRALRGFIGAVCFLCLCPAAFAESVFSPSTPRTISRTGKADHELALNRHGNHDPNNCAVREPPVVDLEMPPSHGVLCWRHVDYDIRAVYDNQSTHCLGQKTSGIGVVYLPRRAYSGADALRYAVRSRFGPIIFNFNLTIVPDALSSSRAAPADISARPDDTLQPPGPIPACAALVS